MALRFSTNNIHSKLGDLNIDSLPESKELLASDQPSYATKSLLSTSLAGENYSTQKPDLQRFLMEELLKNLTDEHPEPELLATSVGKDNDGRLLPSSSTISLLSLSNNAVSVSTNYLDFTPVQKQAPPVVPSGVPAVPMAPIMDRKNSYNNMRSRNSLTHLSQQRLQPYQKLTSPTVGSSAEFSSMTSPQNIPMPRNQSFMTPDSPNLDPTSLGGSPSRFWLSSQTPPRSLLNSLSKSRTHIFPFTQIHSQPHGQHTHTSVQTVQTTGQVPIPHSSSVGSMHSVSKAININKAGGESPVLNPVQTPLEDFPMTPLYLNGGGDNYFVLTNGLNVRDYLHGGFNGIEENEREEEDEDCSMDEYKDVV
ncbi:CIC11C00000003574 [Sungouiella intermedia]|uniref:CIC11C00000003574 n=1 Tax=Sungouiella intermedia TaxID=45354 RepID=A0A1L0BT11_9ASCO|nr:CIC11C00000003574 [[Candida] intermedia]